MKIFPSFFWLWLKCNKTPSHKLTNFPLFGICATDNRRRPIRERKMGLTCIQWYANDLRGLEPLGKQELLSLYSYFTCFAKYNIQNISCTNTMYWNNFVSVLFLLLFVIVVILMANVVKVLSLMFYGDPKKFWCCCCFPDSIMDSSNWTK